MFFHFKDKIIVYLTLRIPIEDNDGVRVGLIAGARGRGAKHLVGAV